MEFGTRTAGAQEMLLLRNHVITPFRLELDSSNLPFFVLSNDIGLLHFLFIRQLSYVPIVGAHVKIWLFIHTFSRYFNNWICPSLRCVLMVYEQCFSSSTTYINRTYFRRASMHTYSEKNVLRLGFVIKIHSTYCPCFL